MLNQNSYIYLLVSEENNIFKIGKADNIINRYETLKSKWGDFNLSNSYQIKCNENNIFKIEKTLHYIFKDFNIMPDYQYDGYTEWFDMKCYKDSEGNTYDFAFGMNWKGVIKDKRTTNYK